MTEPVAQGLIASFAHPGGKVTGVSGNVEDLDGKILEITLEAIPGAKNMGLLLNPEGAIYGFERSAFQAAAQKSGVGFLTAEATKSYELDGAIHALTHAGAD